VTCVMGIDPGKSGGLAWMGLESGASFSVRMPATEAETWPWFGQGWNLQTPDHAFIEKVSAMPGQGVTSMFTFGQNYGFLRACLIAAQIPFETVTPAKWQRMFSLPTLKQCDGSKTKKKNAHKARAQELFPDLKITHYVADAVLLAEYGRRTLAERNG